MHHRFSILSLGSTITAKLARLSRKWMTCTAFMPSYVVCRMFISQLRHDSDDLSCFWMNLLHLTPSPLAEATPPCCPAPIRCKWLTLRWPEVSNCTFQIRVWFQPLRHSKNQPPAVSKPSSRCLGNNASNQAFQLRLPFRFWYAVCAKRMFSKTQEALLSSYLACRKHVLSWEIIKAVTISNLWKVLG